MSVFNQLPLTVINAISIQTLSIQNINFFSRDRALTAKNVKAIKIDVVKSEAAEEPAEKPKKKTKEHSDNLAVIVKYFGNGSNTKAIIIGLTNNEILTKLNAVPIKTDLTKATPRGELVDMLYSHFSDYPEDAKAFII